MALNLLPLVLIGLSAAVLKGRKKARKSMAIWDVPNAFWTKLEPRATRGVEGDPYWGSDFATYKDAAGIVRTGDLIQVGVLDGFDRNFGYAPRESRTLGIIEHGKKDQYAWAGRLSGVRPKEAWYVVTHSPADLLKMKDGRRVILEALLLHGRAPKKWTIVDRKGVHDYQVPRHTSFATRFFDTLDPYKEGQSIPLTIDSWNSSGYLLLPEIAQIVRDKKSIYANDAVHDLESSIGGKEAV